MRRITFSLMLLSCLLVLSCNNDENNNDDDNIITTVAQDKENINATFENTIEIITEMRDGDFVQSLFSFINLDNGDVLDAAWLEELSSGLDVVITQDPFNSDGHFMYSTLAGIYTWNISSKTWSKTSGSEIVFKFPATENSTSNNFEFAFLKYSDASFTVNNDLIYLPTEVEASLKKDNIAIMTLDASITYNPSGFPVPTIANIELFLKPTTFSLTFKRLTDTQFESQLDITSSNYSTSIYGKVSIAHNDYLNLMDDDFNNIQISFTRDKLNISGSWDIKTYMSLSSPTTDQINSTLNLVVNYNDQKIGDLKFKDVGNETMLYIYYKDETSENMSIYYEPFISDFEAAFSSYFGYNFMDNKKSTKVKEYYIKRKLSQLFK